MSVHRTVRGLALLLLQVAAFGQEDAAAAAAAPAKHMEVGQVKLELLSAGGSSVISTQGTHPKQLLSSPQVSSKQTLQVAFNPTADGQAFKPQQAFLVLQHTATGAAAYAAARTTKSGGLSISAPLSILAKQIGKLPGEYQVSLLVGDSGVANSVQWQLGVVELVLEQGEAAAETPSVRTARLQPVSNVKPIITHLFRAPEKRPPAAVSLAFTGLALAPLVGVVGYVLLGLNANFKAWPKNAGTALAALGFHGLLAAMLGVFLLFWTQWNLAQTLPVVLGLGAVLALVGHQALSGLATERALAADKAKKD